MFLPVQTGDFEEQADYAPFNSHILPQLGLDTTVDLVRYAIRHGLIEA